MLISECIRQLQDIQAKFGDIAITGGFMQDDNPLETICVTDVDGMEIYPNDPNGVAGQNEIDGVMFSS